MATLTKAFNGIKSSLGYGAKQWSRMLDTTLEGGRTASMGQGYKEAFGGAWEGFKLGTRGMTKNKKAMASTAAVGAAGLGATGLAADVLNPWGFGLGD